MDVDSSAQSPVWIRLFRRCHRRWLLDLIRCRSWDRNGSYQSFRSFPSLNGLRSAAGTVAVVFRTRIVGHLSSTFAKCPEITPAPMPGNVTNITEIRSTP